MNNICIKSFVDAGCLTHLIGCTKTGQALIVDPKHGRHDSYLQAARDFGLRIVAVLDTHTHADHLSDSAAFVRTGVALWMSTHTRCARPHRGLHDGELVRVGELEFKVLELLGHTPDSIGLYGHGVVVTGDTLLAGVLARADFRGSAPEQLFDAVVAKIMTLPDETVVLPGHGYRDVLFTTVGHERTHNADLRFANGVEFAAHLGVVAGSGHTPAIDEVLAANLAAAPRLPSRGGPVTACCAAGGCASGERPLEMAPEALADKRAEFAAESRWLDVRDPHEFRGEHIPGARSYPLSELGFHLAELRRSGPVVLSCRSGARSMTAAKTLQYLGVLEQPINMAGGILRWKELGLPLENGAQN